jgi:hypothetical protein
MSSRAALILRGPPCGGKTTIATRIRQRLPSSHFVSLDDGWGTDEIRFRGADAYADLDSGADVLLVELGFGEPLGEAFLGATRDPMKWLNVLADSGRSIHLFLLKPPLDELRRRIARDRDSSMQQYFFAAALRYERGGICAAELFADRLTAGYRETLIDTSAEPVSAVADRVIAAVSS